MDSVDVAIVGAGPAGAAAALAARRADPSAGVALLDRAAFPRDKVCGDGIAPHAVDVLRALGAADALAGYRPVSRLRVRSAGGRVALRTLARPDYVVPRAVFDARLVAAAQRAGAELWRWRVRHVAVEADRVVLDGRLAARVVIGADGAHSAVARAVGARPHTGRDLAVAVRAYAPAPAGPPCQDVAFVEADRPSYAWSFPIGDGRVNVGYGARADRLSVGRDGLLGRLEAAVGPTGFDPGTARGHLLPLSTGRPAPAEGRVLLAGDAAGLVNPLSGEGIYYAVASGALAGAAALEPRPAACYAAALRRLLGRHLWHTALLSRVLEVPAVAEAGIAAAARRQRAFDDVVDLAIGAGALTPRLAAATARELLGGRWRATAPA